MAKQTANEVDLIQASIKGDNTAFEGLVAKYQSMVCAITYGATGNIGLSEELAQEAFVKAWKDLAQLRELTKFRAWVCSITRTTISNYRRREKRNFDRKPVCQKKAHIANGTTLKNFIGQKNPSNYCDQADRGF